MVTLQILVLSFLVRVQVPQQVNASLFEVRFLFASIRDKRIYKRLNLLDSILYAIDTSAVLSLKVCKYSFYSLSFHSFFIFSSFHFLN